MDDTSDMFL